MDYMLGVKLLCLFLEISVVTSQTMYDCPTGWAEYNDHCYHFVFYPNYLYRDASTSCQLDGAYLVSVNTQQEHKFISDWLTLHDQNRGNQWWTSGVGVPPNMRWEGDGTIVPTTDDKWVNPEDQTSTALGQRIVYEYTVLTNSFLWARQVASAELSYICEISLDESYRIILNERDHLFGTNITDPREVHYGPKFIQQAKSILVLKPSPPAASIECLVQGYPQSSYVWYRGETRGEITQRVSGDAYSITNGKLTVLNPVEARDVGFYQCSATNHLGTVLSDPVSISFGYIHEFSNTPPGPVNTRLYQGTTINCILPVYSPAVDIKWYKELDGPNFMRTDLHPYIFVSRNGKLYFSETSQYDSGFYHCYVTLIAEVGQEMAASQNPSKISLGIELVVSGDMAIDYGPDIHNDFPAVFPVPSLRGETLVIECFAFGRLPLVYSWSRDNGPVPGKAEYQDHNRMLILPNAQLEDSGNYTCKVERDNKASQEKSLRVVVEARPFFIFPLKDQHIDIEQPLTWRCEALAVPNPVYSWYKNGKLLTNIEDDLEVRVNMLYIKKVESKHQGMYQCSATNRHGTTFSTAQLRVLSFKPTFMRNPVNPSQFGTIEGSVTIICHPEAAPAPAISWLKDGRTLPISDDEDGRIVQLSNGNLIIRELQLSDQGTYTCTAVNGLGDASSSGLLTVLSRVVINIAPADTRVDVNSTAFLACEASFNAKERDLVYVWDLNGRVLDIGRYPQYMLGTQGNIPGLYVVNAQLSHKGRYTCTATTVDDKVSRSAYLDVSGPPSECSAPRGRVQDRNVTLTWIRGAANGAPIVAFRFEYNTNFNDRWRTLLERVEVEDVVDMTGVVERLMYTVGDLKPGTSYRFRVTAMNRYGLGPPSGASLLYKINDAAPIASPSGIAPAWGPVGTLPITWDHMSEEDLTGDGVGYKVYYRRKETKAGQWSMSEVQGRTNYYTALVGALNYYLKYEIMVQAFNSLGHGPNSSIVEMMSAEDMPVAAPQGVYGDGFNGTALMVYWEPIPNDRQYSRGMVLGYQVNYWSMNIENPDVGGTNIYCDCGEGLIVGLDPNDDYYINIQVFTAAGLGPVSGIGYGSTFIFPPLNYPEYVTVQSYKGNAVSVSWRGVGTGLLEEGVIGYKIRWWPATEDIRIANDTITKDKRTHAVVYGIQRGVVYSLRVLGYSMGGDGAKSPTIYFTLEGQVVYNPETTEIMNSSPSTQELSWKHCVLLLCHVTFVLSFIMTYGSR